jgi:hypothetical protein
LTGALFSSRRAGNANPSPFGRQQHRDDQHPGADRAAETLPDHPAPPYRRSDSIDAAAAASVGP